MEKEREIKAYKSYFADFIQSIGEAAADKIFFVLEMLRSKDRISSKFVKFIRDGLFEIRVEYNGNNFRVFFIFDNGNVVILLSGFRKKTQKAPEREIKKALKLKDEYYATKRNQ